MCSYALTGTSSKGHSSERVSSLSCAMKINGMTKWYGVSTIDIDFTIEKTKQKNNKKVQVHLLHMLQPPLAWEQVKVWVCYVKLHRNGERKKNKNSLQWGTQEKKHSNFFLVFFPHLLKVGLTAFLSCQCNSALLKIYQLKSVADIWITPNAR